MRYSPSPMSSPDPVAVFLASHGVTHCPTAAVAPTSATIPETDRQALAAHRAERLARYDHQAAVRAAFHRMFLGLRRRK